MLQHPSHSCRNANSSCVGQRHTNASVCPSDEPGRRPAAAPSNRRAGQRCCRCYRRRRQSWRAHSCAEEEHAEPDAATVWAVERGSHDSRGALHRVARSVAARSTTRSRRLDSLALGAGPRVSRPLLPYSAVVDCWPRRLAREVCGRLSSGGSVCAA